jgi:hypothetical protein
MNRRSLLGSISAGLTIGLGPGLVFGAVKKNRWKIVDSRDGCKWILKPDNPPIVEGTNLVEAVRPFLITEVPADILEDGNGSVMYEQLHGPLVIKTDEMYGGTSVILSVLVAVISEYTELFIKDAQSRHARWADEEWVSQMRARVGQPQERYLGSLVMVQMV